MKKRAFVLAIETIRLTYTRGRKDKSLFRKGDRINIYLPGPTKGATSRSIRKNFNKQIPETSIRTMFQLMYTSLYNQTSK